MTAKLHFDATKRVNHLPNIFMRTQFLKKLSALFYLGLLCGAGLPAAAQIAVGANGSTLQTFDVLPPAESWSTLSLTGAQNAPETDATMDQFVNGATNAASVINAPVVSNAANPPGAAATAQWSSTGFYLQTRPTGNAATFLMATLLNASGGSITNMKLNYTLTVRNPLVAAANEVIQGHRVYYNVTGAAGSWVPLGDFGANQPTNVAQNITITVSANWTDGTAIYILFADDNSVPNEDAANGIDNFVVTNVFVVAVPTPPFITSQPQNQSVQSGSSATFTVGAAGSTPLSYQWRKNSNNIPGATSSSYTIVNAQSGDQAFYQVIVNNAFGTATSTNAFLTVATVSNGPYVLIGLTNYFWKYDQSDTDLVGWQGTNYNDSAWPSGRGVFAFEDNPAITPLTNTVLTHLVPDTITRYFRTTFVLPNDPALVMLVSSNLFDDGAVVYLNGTEVFRYNMPVGAVTRATLAIAANPAGEGTFIVSNFPSSRLVLGTNTLAVELHQVNGTSSDSVFGMQVNVIFLPSNPLVITSQPQSITVEETKTATFTLGLQGQPAYYQWYRDGVAVSNGTFNPLVIPVATTSDAGCYYVIVTNSINSVTSAPCATLTVLGDTNAPVLVDADGTISTTNVLVSFSELISPSTATNKANYRITNTLGGTLTITNAVLVNGTNVLLTTTTGRVAGNNYLLIVSNLRDVSSAQNVIAANSRIPIRSLVSLVAFNDVWRFYDPYPPFDADNLGTNWRAFTYTETNAWGDGAGVFFVGADPSVVPGPVGTSLSETPTITSYFRRRFNLQGSGSGLRFSLTHIIDDGAVFYLNGVEIYRFNMPAGPVDYLTRPLTTVGNVSRIGPIEVGTGALRSGTNVLAVELHQPAPADVDKVFGLQLDASVQSYLVGPVIITAGPVDMTVTEGQSATFSVVQVGGATFQWQSNNVNIVGATGPTYTITAVPISLNGTLYRVAVSNGVSGAVFSTNATLRVLSDTAGPTLVSAFAGTNTTITVSFSESVTAASAQNNGNYQVTNSNGALFTVTSATLVNGTNVVLGFASLPYGSYTVVVNNVRDTSTSNNAIAPNSAVTVGFDYSIAFDSAWKYLLVNTNDTIQSTFMGTAYNDAAWSGPSNALLYVEDAALPGPKNTLLALLDGSGNRINTFYFRQRFVAPITSANLTFHLRHIIDDGLVLHLNGVEIYRYNMPAGVITAASQAAANIGDATLLGPFDIVVTNLVGGTNILAAEVHQQGAASSDITFGVELTASIPSVAIGSGTGGCTYIAPSAPALTIQHIGTNYVLNWNSSPVPTNNCGGTTVFTLQRASYLSNAPLNTVWANVTTVSPYTSGIPTNTVPGAGGAAYFRLKSP